MTDRTGIEWTDSTWNPVTGCTEVSAGCSHCYAKTLAERFRGTPGHYFEDGFDVVLRPERLDQVLRWTRPRRIFVNSMSDLLHDQVPDWFIAQVFARMALTPRHTFQLLTKRHGRMRALLTSPEFGGLVVEMTTIAANDHRLDCHAADVWPLPNVWVGVSVENQQWADIRIPALLDTPAAVRFLSCEPLLGPVRAELSGIDWVIVGGESGRDARPMHPDWARSLRDQCTTAGVPFLFKQWGEWIETANGTTIVHADGETTTARIPLPAGAARVSRVGKKVAGRSLGGRTWDEYAAETGADGGC
jgi:protein gp37